MNNKKNVLVLATLDEKGEGHGWSKAKLFESLGFNVQFISLIRTQEENKYFVIDKTKKDLRYRIFYLIRLISQLLFPFSPKMRWFYKGISFANVSDILNKIEEKPDYIFIGSYQLFLSPKTIYKIWRATNAVVTIGMVDAQILGGGCPFPVGCNRGYEEACISCPLYPYAKFIPRNIVKQKEKYFSKIPLHLMGSRYDLQKAKKVSFLKNKQMHPVVTIPPLDFVLSKKEARKKFNLKDDDFVLLAGAVNPNNPAKGFNELITSLSIFMNSELIKKRVTLVLLGKINFSFNCHKDINLVTPGFQNMEGLITAFYACDVFVSPSIEDSGPMMVNYAMNCERPVIAFPVGIAIDLVKHKETGWIAPLADCIQYAEGIKWIYNKSNSELLEIGKNCKDHLNSFANHPWYEFMLE